MSKITCTACGMVFDAGATTAGGAVNCPACGHANVMGATAEGKGGTAATAICGLAVAALVAGLVGWIPFVGLLALVSGNAALNRIDRAVAEGRALRGRGMAKTGIILGLLGTVAVLLVMLGGILMPSIHVCVHPVGVGRQQVASLGQACETYYRTFNAYPPDGATGLATGLLGPLTATGSAGPSTRPRPPFYNPSAGEFRTAPPYVFYDVDRGLPILYYRAAAGQSGNFNRDVNAAYTDGITNSVGGTAYNEGALSAISSVNNGSGRNNLAALAQSQTDGLGLGLGCSMVIIAAGRDGIYFNKNSFNYDPATHGANYRPEDGYIYVGSQPPR